MNGVNKLKRTTRKIPWATKNLAFKLWLQGYSYRKIRDKTGMSLGAIVLSKGGCSVYDTMRVEASCG